MMSNNDNFLGQGGVQKLWTKIKTYVEEKVQNVDVSTIEQSLQSWVTTKLTSYLTKTSASSTYIPKSNLYLYGSDKKAIDGSSTHIGKTYTSLTHDSIPFQGKQVLFCPRTNNSSSYPVVQPFTVYVPTGLTTTTEKSVKVPITFMASPSAASVTTQVLTLTFQLSGSNVKCKANQLIGSCCMIVL